MRIGLQTWGSDGDIFPFMALAAGLRAGGHEVTLAVTAAERKDYGGRSRRLGFSLLDAGHIGTDQRHLVELARRMRDEPRAVRQLDLILREMFEPGVGRMLEVAESLSRENHLLIGHSLLYPLQAAAERAGRPYLTVALNHSALPSPCLPLMGAPNLGRLLNAWVWKLGGRVLNRHILPQANRLRRELGIAPVRSYRDVWESRLANLVAVSPSLLPPCPAWEPHQRVCGFFRMPEQAEPYELPASLRSFLAAGPPPVFCTFGSMAAMDDGAGSLEESVRLLVEGSALAGCRAIVQARWDLVPSFPDRPGLYKLSAAPQSKILPYCSAAVHHGGAGTTQTALLHSLPSVIVPHLADQYFWARELSRLGVARGAPDRRKVSAQTLGEAIRTVSASRGMKERARDLGSRMAGEDGVGAAVREVERVAFELGCAGGSP